jgi:hypothetical protein
MQGQALFRSYGCFFAEFLEDLSLVRLGLLDLNTCVGLRYGCAMVMLRDFSWDRALHDFSTRGQKFSTSLDFPEGHTRIFLGMILTIRASHPIVRHTYYDPSSHRTIEQSWNINHVSIGCGFRHLLRTD